MRKIGLIVLSVLFLDLAMFTTANGQNQVMVVTSSGDTIDLSGSKVHIIGNNGSVDIDEDGHVRERRQVEQSKSSEDKVYTSVEQMPTFPGGESALKNYIDSHIQFPVDEYACSVEGRVVVKFVVTKTGSVEDVIVVRSLDDIFDREAVRLCKSLPNFVPGRQNGKPVNVWYTLPIYFNWRNVIEKRRIIKTLDDVIDASSVEQMSTFPGGEAALIKWIYSHIQRPNDSCIQGKVIVQFVVTKTGRVGDVKIVRSLDKEFDQEAIRVCKSLPNFIPGRQDGKPVATWYTIPITFKL